MIELILLTGLINSNTWQPYYLTIVVAVVFSTLQGVQDNLDDPFDGIREDDIKVEMMDEWTCILQNMDPSSTKYSGTIYSFIPGTRVKSI